MECPHCNKEIPGTECSECGAMTPLDGRYCMDCGANLERDSDAVNDDDEDLDFEDRVLCSDGTCTGIIINGKCTECGKT
ncbi:MAG: hypothetical protein SV375_12030 [Thermodesulfobacteriota bacterium]|nr:hypothetical protein [Thermodesulfobacteriota bacterium]